MPVNAPSPPPTRNPAGANTDAPYMPLAQSGMGNPFFYHQFADDFDNALGATGLYVTSGTGSVAHSAGDGGLALFSTLAGAGTFASIQTPQPSFTLPTTGTAPPGTSTSVKKFFYLARIQLSDVTLSAFVAGVSAVDATPFTAILDGIWFAKAASSTVLTFNIAATAGQSPTGVAIAATVAIPASAYSLVNATFIDLAFAIDRAQNIYVFVGSQLVGYMPQSGSGAINVATGVTLLPSAGPVAALQQGNPLSVPLSLANMSPILGVSNGATAAIKTMTADFHLVQKER